MTHRVAVSLTELKRYSGLLYNKSEMTDGREEKLGNDRGINYRAGIQ